MKDILDLKNLNLMCTNKKSGIFKQWIYSKDNFIRICDYMQKINYSIQDLNNEIPELAIFDRKNVVFIICLVDWIKEAVQCIFSAIHKPVIDCFAFTKQDELEKARKYFEAIRSFVVAHPLNTSRHKGMGFDGDFICIDIRNYENILLAYRKDFNYTLNFDGITNTQMGKADFYLFCYSQKLDTSKYFRTIGCNYSDIYNVARLYIDYLYELNCYLGKQLRKNFKN